MEKAVETYLLAQKWVARREGGWLIWSKEGTSVLFWTVAS
jgi:hypothetical protein